MYKKILVPVDGSALSLRALDEAINLGRAMGSRLCVVHVISPQFPHFNDLETIIDIKEVEQRLTAHGGELLKSASDKARAAGLEVEVELHNAKGKRVALVLQELAEAWGATSSSWAPTGAPGSSICSWAAWRKS